MIKKFTQYNESVRSMMKPKSWEDVEKNIPHQLVELYERIPYEKRYQFYSADDDRKEDKVKIYIKFKHRIVWIIWQHSIEKYEVVSMTERLTKEKRYHCKDIVDVLYVLDLQSEISESVRDMLKPKSREELGKIINKKSYEDKIRYGLKMGVFSTEQMMELKPLLKLQYGCIHNHLWLVKLAIKEGVDVHFMDDYALYASSENGHIDIVKYLLKIGNYINPKEDRKLQLNRYSAIGRAIYQADKNKHKDIIDLLNHYRIKNKNKINESVRDAMKPKSREELKSLVDKEPSLLQKAEMISRLELEDMFTRDELDKINSVEYEIDIEKQFGKYDVTYTFIADDTFTTNSGIKEITGTLEPYRTGRSTDYKFETDWFTDVETEAYWDENWEDIQDRILDKFDER